MRFSLLPTNQQQFARHMAAAAGFAQAAPQKGDGYAQSKTRDVRPMGISLKGDGYATPRGNRACA